MAKAAVAEMDSKLSGGAGNDHVMFDVVTVITASSAPLVTYCRYAASLMEMEAWEWAISSISASDETC
jgi:hypothetical protein